MAISLRVGLLVAVMFLSACGAAPEQAPAAGEPQTETTLAAGQPPEATAGVLTPTQPASPQVPEQRLLVLEWPQAIRAGDAAVVSLSLEADAEGNITPTAQVAGNQIRGEPVTVPNVYATHNVVVRTRLDLAGIQVAPQGEVAEPMQPGQTVTFFWSVRPTEVGHYVGMIWVHLEFVPRDPDSGLGTEQVTVSAQQFEFEATNLFGLGGSAARLMGGVGVVLGAMLGLDKIAELGWGLFRALFARRENG